ncbi:MAG TPA: transposase [Gammaproteobacteria bacterium]|nr:transposase [Gammaproteobacteria bacterium]
MGRSCYKILDPELPHFVTCTVLHWIPVFTRPATVDIVLDSLRYLVSRGLKLYAYVILENHLHLVVQSKQLDDDIARFKSYTARRLINYLDEQKVNYIHANPVKRGYVDQAEHWRYSSARNYLGDEGLIEVCKLW